MTVFVVIIIIIIIVVALLVLDQHQKHKTGSRRRGYVEPFTKYGLKLLVRSLPTDRKRSEDKFQVNTIDDELAFDLAKRSRHVLRLRVIILIVLLGCNQQ